MTRSKNPHRSLSYALRGKFLITLGGLLCSALLMAGCKKDGNSGITGNADGNSGSTSEVAVDTSSAEVIKSMANEQGKATRPDKGNFTVEYAAVRNPDYAQINEQFRQQRRLESIADDLNASIAIPVDVVITF